MYMDYGTYSVVYVHILRKYFEAVNINNTRSQIPSIKIHKVFLSVCFPQTCLRLPESFEMV